LAVDAPPTDRLRRFVTVVFAFSGMAALVYEVVWTRELSLVFGSTVYAVSIMLGAFMSGLSLGGFLGGRWADSSRDLGELFAKLEFGIAMFGLLSIPLIRGLPTIYFTVYNTLHPSFVFFFGIQLALSFLVMIGPTTLMGATFPVVSKIASSSLDAIGRQVGSVYAVNTLGSIAGSLLAGFLFIPFIGVRGTIFVAAGINLAVSGAMMWATRNAIAARRVAIGAAILAVAVSGSHFLPEPAVALGFYRLGRVDSLASYREAAKRMKTVFSREGVYSDVAVVKDSDGGLSLHNGGMTEGSSYKEDGQTTHLLAYLPVAAARDPHSALVIGLGTGYTSKSLLELPLVRVDTVEINPAVVPASRFFVGELSDDPRWNLHVTDGRNYLYRTRRTFDVITSEPSWPLNSGVSHLFTEEFFVLAREHINDGGVFCQWLPRYLLERRDFMMMYKTFHEVFPQSYVWSLDSPSVGSNELFLVGVKGGERIDQDEVGRRVDTLLADHGFAQTPFHPFESVQTMADSLTDPTVPLNTDDHPYLEFNVVKNRIRWFNARR